MPYIQSDTRSELIPQGRYRHPLTAGELNYVITSAVNAYLAYWPLEYNSINEAIGVLECAKLELYRRIAAPYEDTKIVANGDVYTCNTSTPKG